MTTAPLGVVGLTRRIRARAETAAGELLDNLLDRVAIALVRRRPDALIVVSADDFAAYRETVEVLEDPAAMEDLKISEQQADDEGEPWEDVRRGLGLA